ncbi:thioredoxin domain-containing protein [Geobacter sp. OR-1]|uniref:thioredoxin domain-containing protein n=1 Tax=Geobacter sp. OR-1 TaxID=1266765 RepID=UPI001ED9A80B|nr:thioredoxin domain-containing protein [Geobacter sp. OR-1]
MNNRIEDENTRIRLLIEVDKGTLPTDGGQKFNRLIFSTSPYLLQHADNPVGWFPWGEAAFEIAISENKPVFLSIGYSSCHWCHVMAHESFEDPDVAAIFNRSFICIKVDREERPDIDEQYMAVAQLMTGSGGWPLNVFMTPDKIPFYATTYIPRNQTMGMPGIIQVLEYFAKLWRTDRNKLEHNSIAALKALGQVFSPQPGTITKYQVMDEAYRQLIEIYDSQYGGFGNTPKFPMPIIIDFLLRYGRSGNSGPLQMVTNTLRQMRNGGIYDQLGFGFHRYSVDRNWLVPHFEKMLYDQALISLAYLGAFQSTSDQFFRQVAEEIFSYVLNDMTSPDGAFFAGQDADSEGMEGKYYLWTTAEIQAVIGKREAGSFLPNVRCYRAREF